MPQLFDPKNKTAALETWSENYFFRLIQDLKSSSNSNSHGDHIALNRRVESLQSELDLRTTSDATRINELNETVSNLESKNIKLQRRRFL